MIGVNPKRGISFFQGVIILVLYLIYPSIFYSIMEYLEKYSKIIPGNLLSNSIFSVCSLILFKFVTLGIIIYYISYLKGSKFEILELNISKSVNKYNFVLIIILSIFDVMFQVSFISYFWEIIPAGNPDHFFRDISNPVIYLFGTGLVIPFVEEFFYREIILKNFLKRYQSWLAILFSAILFGISHTFYLKASMTFLGGLIYGLIYFKTGSFLLVFMLHSLNNIMAFFIDELLEILTITEIPNIEFFVENFTTEMCFLVSFLGINIVLCILYRIN